MFVNNFIVLIAVLSIDSDISKPSFYSIAFTRVNSAIIVQR